MYAGAAMEHTARPILVIDPERHPVVAILEPLAVVVHCRTVEAGLRVFRNVQPCVAVVEYRLPDGSGLELIAHVALKSPITPTVMVTAAGSETVCAAAFRLGVADCLVKPIVPAQLEDLAHRFLTVKPNPTPSLPVPRTMPVDRDAIASVAAKVRQAARLIDVHYDQPLSLDQLARAVGMTRFALSRHFARLMGRSLRRYQLDIRLLHAKQLLTDTTRPVTETAHLVGFGDLPRFDKVFRAATGSSPSAFRADARNDKRSARNY